MTWRQEVRSSAPRIEVPKRCKPIIPPDSSDALCGRGKCFDDPAVGDGVAAIGIYQRVEFTSKRGEVCNFASDRVAVLVGNDIDSDARPIAVIGKPHQLAYLVDREAKIARTTDEGKAA